MEDDLKQIREEILLLADEKFRAFQIKLLPDYASQSEKFIGVRLPELRKMAKKIARKNGAVYLKASLEKNPEKEFFEEIMLQGMVIGYMREDISGIFSYTEKFLPKIDNWSVCDSFCSGWKHAVCNQDKVWNWLNGLLDSKEEFIVRYVVVMLLNYYMNDVYVTRLFPIFDSIHHDGYYVKMAVAWAVSICYVKYPCECMNYLCENKLDNFTYNKALQKITESKCISVDEKEKIRKMRRNRAQ